MDESKKIVDKKIKNVYVSPLNDISVAFSLTRYFKEKYKLLGFIDSNNRSGNTIKNIDSSISFDLIFICSPNYFQEIYEKFIESGINRSKIKFYLNNLKCVISRIKYVDFLDKGTKRDYAYIRKLKNKHRNKKIFLIGNGPSLDTNDLNLLKSEITIAANKIFLAYENTTWRPTYYMVEDDLVYKQNYSKISELTNSVKLFPQYSLEWDDRIKNAYYFKMKYFPDREDFPQFNPDPINGMFWGSTIVYTMIQWAIYLGCKEIYLLGLDFDFIESKKYIMNENNRKDLICEGEVNHFHKDYRKVGEKWNLPNLDVQLNTFKKAEEYCTEHGIRIYNASRKTKLDIFDKIKLELLLKKG